MQPSSPTPRSFRFQLKHVISAMAILGASLGLFGKLGLIVGGGIVAFWASRFSDFAKSNAEAPASPEPRGVFNLRRVPIVELIVLAGVLVHVVVLFMPLIDAVPPYFRTRDRMYRITSALAAYQENYGSLPPANVVDPQGRPMHSWRVLILPELGYQKLFNDYHLDEPWDSPLNRDVLNRTPSEYQSHRAAPTHTSVLTIVGPHTAWPGETSRTLPSLRNHELGPVIAVWCDSKTVPWTSPVDLDDSEARRVLTQPPKFPNGFWQLGILSSTCYGHLFAVSQNIVTLGSPTDEQLVRAIEFDAGISDTAGARYSWTERQWTIIHWQNISRFTVFAIVIAWPLVWLRRPRARPTAGSC